VSPQSAHFQQQIVAALYTESKAGLAACPGVPVSLRSTAFPQDIEAVILSSTTKLAWCREAASASLYPLRPPVSSLVNVFEIRLLNAMATFYIQQFGCRATQADGAALERQLLDRGYIPGPDAASADIVVLNTCTVTAAADAQARDSVRKIHTQNPAARLVVTGCYAQRAPEELAALSGVSWVVGNSHKPQIPNLIDALSSKPAALNNFVPTAALVPDSPALFHSFVGEQLIAPHPGKAPHSGRGPNSANVLTGDVFLHPELLSAPIRGGESHHTRPILKIQDGCNNRCSFCVIPFVRGNSRSLSPDAVIREIEALVGQTGRSVSSSPEQALLAAPPNPLRQSSAAREIVLSGINLGTYGRDLSPRVEFIDLIRRILDETPVERLRISSIEPLDVTQDLIELFASSNRVARHFHMPLQSASDRILAAMHRWYRSEHYARRVELVRDRLPRAAIGADVIAGFPGETEADHAATLCFIERLPFTYLHVFSYSPRPGTKAALLPDQVPQPTIKRRARELRSLAESKSSVFRRSQIGRIERVLTLYRDEHAGSEYTPSLSSNYLRVQVPGIFPANRWLDVVATAEEGNYMVGEPAFSLSETSAYSASRR
jgi:threonylcarbamoyladenosine tRNA methylthiotransferase MtaB